VYCQKTVYFAEKQGSLHWMHSPWNIQHKHTNSTHCFLLISRAPVFKGETFHGVCLQKKMKEERTVRRSIRGSVKNEQKVARVHAENMKTEIDSKGQLKFVGEVSDGTFESSCNGSL
jgi:hypothetical protein